MADNVTITPGSGNTVAADEVADATLGTVKVQYVKLMDGTLDGTTKAVVGATGLKIDGSAVIQPVSGTFFQATQPISAATLPLPSGASTEATLALIKAKTDNLDVALSTRTKPADAQGIVGTQTSASGALNALNAAVTLAIGGYQGASSVIFAGTLTGTVVAEQSFDNGTTWFSAWLGGPVTGVITGGTAFTNPNPANGGAFKTESGATHVRLRVSVFTSGTANASIFANFIRNDEIYTYGKDPVGILRPILCDISGNLILAPSTLCVTGTAAISTGVTVTLPAVAGQFHYITMIEIVKYAGVAVVGAAAPVVVTTTNLPGNPAYTFDTAAAIGTAVARTQILDSPLKSSVVNTATTIVCPLTTSIIWRVNVYYYTAS